MTAPNPQYLLKRNPAITTDEFSAAWLHHAELVLPYFLQGKVEYYAQIHGPLSSTEDVSEWDGAAEMVPGNAELSEEEEAVRARYYREVILVDEKKLLVDEALKHLQVTQGVEGRKVVFIEGGKPLIQVREEVKRVWAEYFKNGEEK